MCVCVCVLQLLKKSILQMGIPAVEAVESPPFEKPSIEQVNTNKSARTHTQTHSNTLKHTLTLIIVMFGRITGDHA